MAVSSSLHQRSPATYITMPATTRATTARGKRATRASTGASGAKTRNASDHVYDELLSEDEAGSGHESDESEYGGLCCFLM